MILLGIIRVPCCWHCIQTRSNWNEIINLARQYIPDIQSLLLDDSQNTMVIPKITFGPTLILLNDLNDWSSWYVFNGQIKDGEIKLENKYSTSGGYVLRYQPWFNDIQKMKYETIEYPVNTLKILIKNQTPIIIETILCFINTYEMCKIRNISIGILPREILPLIVQRYLSLI